MASGFGLNACRQSVIQESLDAERKRCVNNAFRNHREVLKCPHSRTEFYLSVADVVP